MKDYRILNKCTITNSYLHTNASTHKFIFGAIAELIDNARDAKAANLHIFTVENHTVRGKKMLCFLDDGEGMDPMTAKSVIAFGSSTKRDLYSDYIGQYGNGLKSGSIRLADDFILFTKQNSFMTVLFYSSKYHTDNDIQDAVLAIPTFNEQDREPWLAPTDNENMRQMYRERYELEMDIIYKYSPFKTKPELMTQFDRISGSNGTLMILFNLIYYNNEKLELDFDSDPCDILTIVEDNEHKHLQEIQPIETRSLRAYTSILYLNPKMQIFIQRKKVKTQRLDLNLYEPRSYGYVTKNVFKKRAEADLENAKKYLEQLKAQLRTHESKAIHAKNTADSYANAELQKEQNLMKHLKNEVKKQEDMANQKKKAINEPKVLTLIFGFNVNNRTQEGLFIYNCHRLITMYDRVGPQRQLDPDYSGICCIVDVPYSILEPQHGKQGFVHEAEYRKLQNAVADHMTDYLTRLKKQILAARKCESFNEFWAKLGYANERVVKPSNDEFNLKFRQFCNVLHVLQCSQCLKWRQLPIDSRNRENKYADNWNCEMARSSEISCNKPEVVTKIQQWAKLQKQPQEPSRPKPSEPPKSVVATLPVAVRPHVSQASTVDKQCRQRETAKKSTAAPTARKRVQRDEEGYDPNEDPVYEPPCKQTRNQSLTREVDGIIDEIENEQEDDNQSEDNELCDPEKVKLMSDVISKFSEAIRHIYNDVSGSLDFDEATVVDLYKMDLIEWYERNKRRDDASKRTKHQAIK